MLLQVFSGVKACFSCICTPLHSLNCKNRLCLLCWKTRMDDNLSGCEAQLLSSTDVTIGINSKSAPIRPLADEEKPQVMLNEEETCLSGPEALLLEPSQPEAKKEGFFSNTDPNVVSSCLKHEVLLTEVEPNGLIKTEAALTEAEPEAVLTEAAEPEAVLTQAEPEAVLTQAEPKAVLTEAIETELVLTEEAEPEAVLNEAAEPEAVLTVAIETEVVLTEAAEPEAVLNEAAESEGVLTEVAEPEAVLTQAEPEAVLTQAEPEAVLTQAEPEAVLTQAEPEAVLTQAEPEDLLTQAEPEDVLTQAEPEDVLTQAEPEDVLTQAEPEDVRTQAEPEDVLTQAEPEDVLTRAEPEDVLTRAEPEDVLTRAEPENVLTQAEPEDVLTQAEPEAVLTVAEPDPYAIFDEDVLTEAEPEAVLTESKPEAGLVQSESVVVLTDGKPEVLLNETNVVVEPTNADEEAQNCLHGKCQLFENIIQHEKDQSESELLEDATAAAEDLMESSRYYDGASPVPSETFQTTNPIMDSEVETDKPVELLIEGLTDLVSVSEEQCLNSEACQNSQSLIELLGEEDTAMTQDHNTLKWCIPLHSIVDNSAVVAEGENNMLVPCTPSNPDHCESLPSPEDPLNPAQCFPEVRESRALNVESHPLSDLLTDVSVLSDAKTTTSSSNISITALSTVDAVATKPSEVIVADTNSSADSGSPRQCTPLHPAQWCEDCGRLAELEGENTDSFLNRPLGDVCTAFPSGNSELERCSAHLPGCKYWLESASQLKEERDGPPCQSKLADNTTCQGDDVTVGSCEADIVVANKTTEGCVSANVSSDLVNTVGEHITLAMPSVSGNDAFRGKGSVNFSIVDVIPSFAIPGTQPNSDGTNLLSASEGVGFIRDVVTDVAPSDSLSNLSGVLETGVLKSNMAVSGGDAVLSEPSKDSLETNPATVACSEVGEIDNVSNNPSCGVSTSRTEKVVSNNIISTSRTEEVVSNSSSVTSKQEANQTSVMKRCSIERHSVKQSNFSASSQELDSVDIGCGFASLGSVLFEKCKTRRSEVSFSKEMVPAASVVHGTSTPHLESCALSDTPLYVPPEPSDSPKQICPDNLDAELSKSSASFSTATNVQINSFINNPDPLSTIYPAHHRPVGMNIPERRLGVFGSQSNPCILEEVDENGVNSGHHSVDSAAAARISYMHSGAPRDKVPLYKEARRDEVIATTSAPCSPVPQGAANIHSVERRRKHNTCVRRRVSFPEDDTRLITSYLEPVDPWERMNTSVTSDEVMAAYVSSCTSHSCQPIPAVLNQIAALPLNIPGRIECFSLRGCKLDLSQCEGLEEILKRVQFVNIDFENCSLTDDTVIPLVDMIEFYDSTTQLNISCNSHIGSRGWQACARMLKKTQSVHYLDARSTNLNEVNMPILGKALRLGTRLHTLHLENCNLTGRPLITLAAALKLNDTLVKLYLADNRLGSNDCIQIGNLMRNNLTLKLLDLRNNNLQDAGCAHVCEGVAEQNKQSATIVQKTPVATVKSKAKNIQTGLNSLVLWNNHMTVTSARHIAAMMLSTTSLETLNVGRNSITNDGVIRMKDSLLRNKSLRRLYLHATKIGDEGAVALAEFIAESKHIERVDLRDNTIKVAGLLALAHSLRHNSSVVQMDLDSNPRSEPVTELAEKHVSLLIQIKEYACRNRTQSHVAVQENKDSDTEDYNLDPDFRKLSLSSEIAEGGHITLEVPTTPGSGSSSRSGNASDEPKKYRSPSPSPCGSPVPSPSPSPIPSPSRNRFKVFKVTPDSSPTSSVVVNANPLFSGDGFGSPMSHLFSNTSAALSSSCPVASTIALSTTSRPVFYQPQPVVRNRFLSGGGGRFTVTKVTDAGLSSLPNLKTKSASLSHIPKPAVELGAAIASEPTSPQIVISSPAKIERGFSLDEGAIEEAINKKKLKENASNAAPVEVTVSNPDLEKDATATTSCLLSGLVENKSDSTESDDVFVDSVSSQSVENFAQRGCAGLPLPPAPVGGGLSPSSTARRELTDSGFLEEPNPEFEDALSSLPVRPVTSQDGDRDSLFSNTSDPGGHSPLLPIPPDGKPLSPSFPTNPLPPFLSPKSVGQSSPTPAPSIITSPVSTPAPTLVSPPPGDRMKRLTSSESTNSLLLRAAQQRAPLASMENGSFDTDSEDSELTTQSSDSTHSDEVRITAEGEVVPQLAWGLASVKGDVGSGTLETKEDVAAAAVAADVSTEVLLARTSKEEAVEKLGTCRAEGIQAVDTGNPSSCLETIGVHEESIDHIQASNKDLT